MMFVNSVIVNHANSICNEQFPRKLTLKAIWIDVERCNILFNINSCCCCCCNLFERHVSKSDFMQFDACIFRKAHFDAYIFPLLFYVNVDKLSTYNSYMCMRICSDSFIINKWKEVYKVLFSLMRIVKNIILEHLFLNIPKCSLHSK